MCVCLYCVCAFVSVNICASVAFCITLCVCVLVCMCVCLGICMCKFVCVRVSWSICNYGYLYSSMPSYTYSNANYVFSMYFCVCLYMSKYR